MAVSTPTKKRRTPARQPERVLAAQTRKVFANLPPDVQDLVRQAAGHTKPNGGAATPQISAEVVKKLAPDVRDMLRKATKVALAGGPSFADTTAPSLSTSASIVDEQEKGGPAFGAFIKSVGLGAAAAQKELDQDLVDTASKLSNTNIDVIAVFEQVLDDDGQLKQGIPHQAKLPLINYLMPTAYQWTRVFLTADMQVSQFNSENGFNIKSHSDNFSAGISGSASMFGGSISGHAEGGFSNAAASGGFSASQSTAAGQMHMEATLEPRPDVMLPKPFVIQKGPRLKLTMQGRTDIQQPGANTGDPPKVVGHKLPVTAHLTKADGTTANAGKMLDIRVSEPLIDWTVASQSTDTNGDVVITLQRTGAAYDPAKILSAIVTVSFGLITETIGVQL
jgi:hypothetical protein